MIKSRSTFLRLLAAASVVLCVVSTAKAQDKILLRMNLHPGQTFDQGYAMQMDTSGGIANSRMDMSTTGQFGIYQEVLGVDDDGNIKLKSTYQTIVSKTRGVIGETAFPSQNYDSRKPPKKNPAGLEPLAGMVGASIVATMSPQGKVLKVEGIDAIIQRQLSGTKNPKERAVTEGILKKTLESTTKTSAGVVGFPEAAVAIGDSWTSVVSSPILPQLSMKYTLMSSKDGVATIAVHADFSPNSQAPPIKMPQFQMKTVISGTESGVMRVDEKTGLTISSELHMRMKDVITMTVPKSTSKNKSNPEIPSSITMYMKSTMRSWTVKLPQ